MKKSFAILLLGLLMGVGCGTASTTTLTSTSTLFTEDEQTITQAVQEDFLSMIDCSADSQDEYRDWCAVTKLGEETTTFTPPSEKTIYLGLSIFFQKGRTMEDAISDRTVSALHMSSKEAFLYDVLPSSDEERQEVKTLIPSLSAILEASNPSEIQEITLSPSLYEFLQGKNNKEGFPLTYDTTGAKFGSAGMTALVYQIGEVYVVIETVGDAEKYANGEAGVYVSVYPLVDVVEGE